MNLDYTAALRDAGYRYDGADAWKLERRYEFWTIQLHYDGTRLDSWEANNLTWQVQGVGSHSLCQYLTGAQRGGSGADGNT